MAVVTNCLTMSKKKNLSSRAKTSKGNHTKEDMSTAIKPLQSSTPYQEVSDEWDAMYLPDGEYAMMSAYCPHQKLHHECDDCMQLSDHAYDAWRETQY